MQVELAFTSGDDDQNKIGFILVVEVVPVIMI